MLVFAEEMNQLVTLFEYSLFRHIMRSRVFKDLYCREIHNGKMVTTGQVCGHIKWGLLRSFHCQETRVAERINELVHDTKHRLKEKVLSHTTFTIAVDGRRWWCRTISSLHMCLRREVWNYNVRSSGTCFLPPQNSWKKAVLTVWRTSEQVSSSLIKIGVCNEQRRSCDDGIWSFCGKIAG